MIDTYVFIFCCTVLAYIWYRYIFLGASKEVAFTDTDSQELISIVIPAYNESAKTLIATLNSVYLAHGKKEIILVDDGSPNRKDLSFVYKTATKLGIKVILMPQNKGKRHAQIEALPYCNGKYIATIDSDTSIEPDALLISASYLDKHADVGAVTGLVRARNRTENWLTRLIDARYCNAFLFERKSQSNVNMVMCCCGSLTTYRADFFKANADKYANQTFLNKKQNFGDDRHLTNLLLMANYKVKFLETVSATTDVPNNLKQFLKQQLRWNQSFVRENIVLFPFALKHKPLLLLELCLVSFIPLFALPLRLMLILTMVLYPSAIVVTICSIIIMATIRNVWIINTKEKGIYLYNIVYGLLHFLTVYWLLFIAIYKVLLWQNNAWGTRE